MCVFFVRQLSACILSAINEAKLVVKDEKALPTTTHVGDFSKRRPPVDILLAVVNSVEFFAVLRLLEPLSTGGAVLKGTAGKHTYHVGRFGVYAAALVKQSDDGVGLVAGSQVVVSEAIAYWKPKATFMIGIALGLYGETKLGDVLVSARLGTFVVNSAGHLKQGAIVAGSGVHLDPLFDAASVYQWSFDASKVHRGALACGRTDGVKPSMLRAAFVGAVGLDLEGEGVMTAGLAQSTEWIVVKGVRGFVGVDKSTNELDEFAAAAASSLVMFVLKNHCLGALGCVNIKVNKPLPLHVSPDNVPITPQQPDGAVASLVVRHRLVNEAAHRIASMRVTEYFGNAAAVHFAALACTCHSWQECADLASSLRDPDAASLQSFDLQVARNHLIESMKKFAQNNGTVGELIEAFVRVNKRGAITDLDKDATLSDQAELSPLVPVSVKGVVALVSCAEIRLSFLDGV